MALNVSYPSAGGLLAHLGDGYIRAPSYSKSHSYSCYPGMRWKTANSGADIFLFLVVPQASLASSANAPTGSGGYSGSQSRQSSSYSIPPGTDGTNAIMSLSGRKTMPTLDRCERIPSQHFFPCSYTCQAVGNCSSVCFSTNVSTHMTILRRVAENPGGLSHFKVAQMPFFLSRFLPC